MVKIQSLLVSLLAYTISSKSKKGSNKGPKPEPKYCQDKLEHQRELGKSLREDVDNLKEQVKALIEKNHILHSSSHMDEEWHHISQDNYYAGEHEGSQSHGNDNFTIYENFELSFEIRNIEVPIQQEANPGNLFNVIQVGRIEENPREKYPMISFLGVSEDPSSGGPQWPFTLHITMSICDEDGSFTDEQKALNLGTEWQEGTHHSVVIIYVAGEMSLYLDGEFMIKKNFGIRCHQKQVLPVWMGNKENLPFVGDIRHFYYRGWES